MPFSPATAAIFDAAQFARAVEHSAIGTALVGLDGAWLSVNGALRDFLGYSAEELRVLTFQDLTWPEDLDVDLTQLQAVLAGHVSSYQIEKRYVRKDGAVVWAELTVSLVRGAEGQPLFFISHVQDIGARKAAETERAQLAERVTLATRGGGIGIWDWTLDTGRLVWSPEMFTLFGLPTPHAGDTEVSLATFFDMVVPEDRPSLQSAVASAKRGSIFDAEFRIRRPDDAVRFIKAFARVHRDDDGRAVRMLGANWDVTDLRVAAREAQAANRAKSQFLAMMSHEIRTPMNGILGMTQVMLSGSVSEEQRRHLGVIADCGEALVTILNDILDLSKVEAGKLEVEAVPFDLRRVLEGVHATYAGAALAKGVQLELQIEDDVAGYVGDPTRVRQIAANLVSNSVKFTGSGRISLVARTDIDGVVLQVSDTGQGMDQATLARIFRPFTQADASTTRQFGGTGLGLSIVQELVRIMNGAVDVDSRPGDGSCFTIRLPLRPARLSSPVATDAATAGVPPLRVLVAEDNPVNQLVITALLGPLGLEPKVVANGAEAVEAWRDEPWDVVLMDVHMPVMDGFDAAAEIRRLESLDRRPRTPIIALTADAMTHHRQRCLARGMDDLVAKPIQVGALVAALQAITPPEPTVRAA
ncbi:ATP-binding protein [Brevundimonas sp. VNH65]|uniref:ATP-binding protein n=1 Tax=Brevundimonas sp. VNH65 TaxID=3400917 RepID=UPI003C0B2F4E